jgi:hypothetical protein
MEYSRLVPARPHGSRRGNHLSSSRQINRVSWPVPVQWWTADLPRAVTTASHERSRIAARQGRAMHLVRIFDRL